MSSRRNVITGVVLLGAFAGLFIYAGGFKPREPAVRPPNSPTSPKRGNFERYLYAITDLPAKKRKLAQFDPSLPSDDTVVLGVLRAVAKDGYGVVVGPEVQPVVETISEVNYVTFKVGQSKVLFELFRNTTGEVGSARFWAE